jgi:hypothetical protein
MTQTYTIEESNAILYSLVSKTEPFHIARLSDNATKTALYYYKNNGLTNIPQNYIAKMDTHDGIYCKTASDIELYARVYHKAVLNGTYLACFPQLCIQEQTQYLELMKQEKGIHNRALEPFYLLSTNSTQDPWTYALLSKKVLIIHPFVESFKKQRGNGFEFTPKPIFAPDQEFLYYKTYNCLAGNRPHNSWFETFSNMMKDIVKLDFDIALLGCGGYGVPLCNFISQTLKKQAIYIGGGLQLLFGVYGTRWENHEIIGPLIRAPNSKWTRPSEEETIPSANMIERGCYW